ncbi:MAG: AmmeMemoRadiSam system radical SAM enzyme [Gammaproteobacteria bacterium]|nr:AmmeMemoRadiSam system radical SAM enzyme [Gammaproteobacteria bacterium]MDE2345731.1 AmmeMemoRadiSam system radical SAM enzyme [Gammaproteobacteria bacterium]
MQDAAETIVTTRYWHALGDGRVQCDVCPRYCKLHEGQRGLCFVRGCEDGRIKLFSYGRSSGFCVDPVEKKPLNHFLPGTSVLSFGTAGCNLACKFCQNWDMSKSREMDKLMDAATPETLAHAAKALGCASMAYTYNDPVIFMEYAMDAADAGHAIGISSVAVTAGYMCAEPRMDFYRHMDAVNVDLKAFTENFYWKTCGGHLQAVLDTLMYLKHETQVWLEITSLLIPGENDSQQEIESLVQWVAGKLGPDVPLHFTAFHPDWKMQNTPATPAHTLLRARELGIQNGLRYCYTGNVHDAIGGSTYCHHCGALLIERNWYELGQWRLDTDGHCLQCGALLPGVFRGQPGHWGRRRMPVRINQAANGLG